MADTGLWANLQLDDADSALSNDALRSRTSSDEFFGDRDEFGTDFVFDLSSGFVSPIHASPPLSPAQQHEEKESSFFVCPCCYADQPPNSKAFYDHVGACFMLKARSQHRGQGTSHLQEDLEQKIKRVRQGLSSLDIRERIRLMESLSRIAKATVRRHKEPDQPLGSRAQESDQLVLSLLYSEGGFKSRKRSKPGVMKVQSSAKSGPSHLESLTPTMVASTNAFNMDFVAGTGKLGPTRGNFMRSKRKREVAQALSFSVDSFSPSTIGI